MGRLIDASKLLRCIPPEDNNSRFAVVNAPSVNVIQIIYEECCDKCHDGVCETCNVGRALKRLEGDV